MEEEKTVAEVAPFIKEKIASVVKKEERVVEKTAPIVKEIAGEGKVTENVAFTEDEKVVPFVNEMVASVPQEGGKISETVASAPQRDIVINTNNRESGAIFDGRGGKESSPVY